MKKLLFRALSMQDIVQMHCWFNEPHVQKFYSLRRWEKEEVLEKLKPYIERQTDVFGFIILVEEVSVGYIQYYPLQNHPWPEQGIDEEMLTVSAGIDFFIGNESYLRAGFGVQIATQFLEEQIWPKFQCCFVDPEVQNVISIRLFEKCGFQFHKKIHTKNAMGKPVALCLMKKIREKALTSIP